MELLQHAQHPLRAIPLLQDISYGNLERIGRHAERTRIDAGVCLFEEGDAGDAMFFILEGGVEVSARDDDGNDVVLAALSPGDYFGEQALLPTSSGHRSASACATQDSLLLKIDKALFQSCLRDESHIQADLESIGGQQLRHRLAQTSALFRRSVPLGKFQGEWLTEKCFKPGERVIEEGEPGEYFYLILMGMAEVSRRVDGEVTVLGALGPGQYFGELALIHQAPRAASITAKTELLVLALKAEKFIALYETSPNLRSQLNHLSSVYRLPNDGLITLHPGTFMDMEATTTLYHFASGVKLAFTKVIGKPIFCIERVSDQETPGEILRYEDKAKGVFRELRINSGAMGGIICHGGWDDIGHALTLALHGNVLKPRQKALFRREGELRIDKDDDGVSDNAIVCHCAQVTRGQLRAALAEGCESTLDLASKTGASQVCGCCGPALAEIAGRTDMRLVELLETIPVTDHIRAFRFRPRHAPVQLSLPSQHIRLEAFIDGRWVQRAYTLTSAPGQRAFYEISVKREPAGLVSRWLHDEWRENALVRVSAPQGGYPLLTTTQTGKASVFLAAGIGITPTLAFLRSRPTSPVHIDYSARSAQEFAYAEEIKACAAHGNITIHFRDTSTQGHITQHDMAAIAARHPDARYFVCGPAPYLAAITMHLQQLGIAAERVQVEKFHAQHPRENARPATEKIGNLLALLSLLVLLVLVFAPALPQQPQTLFSVLWTDPLLKQITGFSVLGLSLGAMAISLRKRIKAVKFGRFAQWRVAHIALMTLALTGLMLHTGLSLGHNANQMLMAAFLATALLGIVNTKKMATTWHILAAALMPALLIAHIVSGYYF